MEFYIKWKVVGGFERVLSTWAAAAAETWRESDYSWFFIILQWNIHFAGRDI